MNISKERKNKIIRENFMNSINTKMFLSSYSTQLQEEMRNLSDKFQFDFLFGKALTNFYLMCEKNKLNIKVGEVYKTAELVASLLKCFCYEEDEINAFLFNNKRIILSTYSCFRKRLAILNHFGFMKEALFERYGLLNSNYELTKGLGTASLYAILQEYSFDSIDELIEKMDNITFEEARILRKKNPLTLECLQEYDAKMLRDLQKIKIKNTVVKRKKR